MLLAKGWPNIQSLKIDYELAAASCNGGHIATATSTYVIDMQQQQQQPQPLNASKMQHERVNSLAQTVHLIKLK
jgi:hypothetical protein